jgi:hypothetical protein
LPCGIPKQVRRVNGHLRLAALDQTVPTVTPAKEDTGLITLAGR